MAGAGGITSISIEGDQVAGQQYVPRAEKLLRRLVERVNLGGVQTASDFVRLDDTAYCYAVVSHAVAKAVIVCAGSSTLVVPSVPRNTVPQVPDFYSGCVLGGRIPDPPSTTPPTPPKLTNFWPTPACARLFSTPTAPMPTDPFASTKLAVEPFEDFRAELMEPEGAIGYVNSQYVKLKPTMYSGLMRHVVQLLMGFGFQTEKSLYDRTPPPVGTKKQQRVATTPTQYQQDVKKNGLQIRYDWRWYRTHGIAKGADGRLWLVEIGNTRGALAWPLPMNATSQLPAFRQKLQDMGDDAGLYALDKLGGFPTGESMPDKQIDAYVRAGMVLRLATTDEVGNFYDHNTFSSFLGWAFNDSGTEAHNTCVDYDADFYQTCYHYVLSMAIGETKQVDPSPYAAALRSRFAQFSGDERYPAIVFKIGRLDDTDAREWSERAGPDSMVFEDFDQFEVDPQAPFQSRFWLQEKGRLAKDGIDLDQYELKFPSEGGILVSWDMRPTAIGQHFSGVCDTTVFVYFDGDQLKYVRFFNDQRSYQSAVDQNDTDGCEVMGTFTHLVESGTTQLPIGVYSNDFDPRVPLVPSTTTTITTGKDLGYTQVVVRDEIPDIWLGQVMRTRSFYVTIDTKSVQAPFVKSAMVNPFYDRCAYYFAVGTGDASHRHDVNYVVKGVEDPWRCNTWRNFPGYTGSVNGGTFKPAQHPDGCGPVTARTVMHPGAQYFGGSCADFADQGPWCFLCDNADAMVYNIPDPPLPPSTSETVTGSQRLATYLVTQDSPGIKTLGNVDMTGQNMQFPWFWPSPDRFGVTQYIEETKNAFGDSAVMRYYDQPNGTVQLFGAPQPPGLDRNNATFIGVV